VTKTRRSVQLTALAAALAITVLQPGSAGAHKAESSGPTIEVVAEGLDTPRGLLYDPNARRVLVAEAGDIAGDTGPCGPAFGGTIYCFGPTGAVFQYSERSGSTRRIHTGLPSIGAQNGSAVLGLHDLALRGGDLFALFGLSGPPAFRDALGPSAVPLAQLATIARNGSLDLLADLVAFEAAENPHPSFIDSDPYGLLVDGQGIVVADAAGNDVLRVNSDGSIDVLAVFPTRIPAANPNDIVESVPTTVVRGPDGMLYVGELSGFPYYKGEAKVWRVRPGHEPTIFADGFTNIADIAFDHRGRLLVLEMAKEGLFLPEDTVTGRLVRVEKNGRQTDLVTTGLENPGGIAVAGRDTFYVTNRTTSTGNVGQLLKITIND
jgi:hypothetical protein